MRTKKALQQRGKDAPAVRRISYFFFFLGLCWAHVSHKSTRLPYSASIWLPNSGLRFSRVWFTASSLERVLPARASSGSLSAERAPARRALSEMDPRSAPKGGSASKHLRHEVTVRASFSCPRLMFGWLGFVSYLFFCSRSGFGFSGGWGEAMGKALENWLGGHCCNQGLFWAVFWNLSMNTPEPAHSSGGWSPVETVREECEVASTAIPPGARLLSLPLPFISRFPLELSRVRLL